jgi:hypothetical protein
MDQSFRISVPARSRCHHLDQAPPLEPGDPQERGSRAMGGGGYGTRRQDEAVEPLFPGALRTHQSVVAVMDLLPPPDGETVRDCVPAGTEHPSLGQGEQTVLPFSQHRYLSIHTRS